MWVGMGPQEIAPGSTSLGTLKHHLRQFAQGASLYRPSTTILTLATLLLLSLTMTLVLLFWSAKRQDEIALDHSRDLAGAALGAQLRNLKKTMTDYTYWDDAYKNLAETFNPAWYDENHGNGAYLRDTFGITASFVIGPDDRTVRDMHDSTIHEGLDDLNFDSHVVGGFDKLVRQARDMIKGEFPAVGGLVEMGGIPYIAAVRIIHPHTEELSNKAAVTPKNAYLAVFMRPIDEELLKSIANDFGLKGLGLVSGDVNSGELESPLIGVNGRRLATLTWHLELPSRHVHSVILPRLLAIILCIGLLGWNVLYRLRIGQMKLWHAMREAQSADRAKTEFLANMSHALRTPLNAIIGFSELTRDEVFGLIDNRRYVEYATDIHDSARFLLDIIGDILELSKIEAGKLELRLGEVSLRDVIESAGRIITPQAAKKNVSVNLKHDRAIHTIHADERALKQVVLQLLSNAIKFSSDNGTVTVETTRDTSGTICLTVSDTGMGISKEYLPHINGALLSSHQFTDGIGNRYRFGVAGGGRVGGAPRRENSRRERSRRRNDRQGRIPIRVNFPRRGCGGRRGDGADRV